MSNGVGYARPAARPNPMVLGTDGIGADMLEEARLAYARLREDDVEASADVAWDWLATGQRWFPEAAGDRVHLELRLRRLAVARGLHAGRAGAPGRGRRRGPPRRRPPDPGRRRRGAGQGRRAGHPPPRPAVTRGAPMTPAARRMADRVALYLQDAHPIREGMEHARYAEACGFEAVWQAESRLVREATVPMAAFAAVTERIRVGSGVADCWSRNPARLAATFSTLDDLAPGRIILGLGAWWDPLARKVGIDRARPLTVMRRSSAWCGPCSANETVTVDGDYVHLDGVELDYVYQERRAKDVPIYIGATGMQMMELTGEIADGAVLNYLVSPDYNARAMEHLATGAAQGRPDGGRHRPAAARGLLRPRGPGDGARHGPPAWSRSTSASSPTS